MFSLNFHVLVTQPFISWEKSAESQLSVRYYLAGVSHYFFEANGSNSIWFCSRGQLKLIHFLLLRYSAINIRSYPCEIINVLCQTCLDGKLEQSEARWAQLSNFLRFEVLVLVQCPCLVCFQRKVWPTKVVKWTIVKLQLNND